MLLLTSKMDTNSEGGEWQSHGLQGPFYGQILNKEEGSGLTANV